MANDKYKGRIKKILKIIGIAILVLLLVCVVGFYFFIKHIMTKDDDVKAADPGNVSEYDVENVEALDNSPLKGMNILFLGSSVTHGDASVGISFADYIGKRDGVNVTKEAVGGTTLVDEFSIFAQIGKGDGNSYVARLKKVDTSKNFDAVVVQLSTNDAALGKEIGTVSDSMNKDNFDTKTVAGAMEYIIAYVEETWGCPVIYYSGAYYENAPYAEMTELLYDLMEKWGIGVIDLYNDTEFNNIAAEDYDFYMYDEIHPTKAGYLEWWTPAIEEQLYEILSE